MFVICFDNYMILDHLKEAHQHNALMTLGIFKSQSCD